MRASAVAWAGALGVLSGAALAQETPEQRGAYLVRGPMGCGNCHTPTELSATPTELSGRFVEDMPDYIAFAPNITPAGAVAGWSDAELGRAIREGIRPDGTLVGPPMPIAMYRGLSDTDLAAIVAFLRTLKPVESDVPKSVYRAPLPPDYGPPVGHVPDIPRGPTAEYGAYLAGPVTGCLDCHTPMGPDGLLLDTALGQGGRKFSGPWGESVAPNITSSEDGLSGYSDTAVQTMIRDRIRPNGSMMLPPMPYDAYRALSTEDLTALIAYLRTIPPLPDPG